MHIYTHLLTRITLLDKSINSSMDIKNDLFLIEVLLNTMNQTIFKFFIVNGYFIVG